MMKNVTDIVSLKFAFVANVTFRRRYIPTCLYDRRIC